MDSQKEQPVFLLSQKYGGTLPPVELSPREKQLLENLRLWREQSGRSSKNYILGQPIPLG